MLICSTHYTTDTTTTTTTATATNKHMERILS
jgi:hypothetical protein